ncbi:receptor-type tyrosine-protein phosphatase eta-like isoform X2 [Syngnathoides biaculeatus]|uniref:receptor-type tyrosine-protein phosphatase eta-like isoform X2 n=1 Tax=Syngnathoides biaculeatus TaxID=300417 RepID=UPI002ADE1C68|nr:receptor-type tyrosine-protein phosphatase eta-like isoform X2 [Syngnathoides biaculeatus]
MGRDKPEKATNLVVNNFTTSSITVSWTQPEGNFSFYIVQWTDGNDPQRENVTTMSKSITGLSPGTLYNISVTTVADDRMTEGAPAAVSHYTKPEKATNLVVNSFTTSSITVSWIQPEGNFSFYIVQWTNGKDTQRENATTMSKSITGLSPGTLYNISVTTVADDRMTEGAPAAVSQYTRPERPEEIMVTAGTENMKIEWNLFHGRADFYVVNISNEEVSYSFSKNTTANTTNFTGLYPGRVYFISVIAFAGTLSNTSNQISFATFPTPPGSLNVMQRTNASIHLQWETPTKMEGAPLISYHIAYQQAGGSLQTANTTNNSMVLSQLSSGTLYNVTVDTVGPQNLMSSVVHRSAYTLPNPVVNLVSSPFNATSIKVAWSSPYGVQTYYEYLVQTYKSTGTLVKPQTVSNNNADVHDLEPGTKYNISVTTLATAGSESTEEHTLACTMPNPVTKLQVQDFNTTAIQLIWHRSSDYKDTYTYLLTTFQDDTMVYNVTTKTEMYTLLNLTPGTLYNLHVFTVVEALKSTPQQAWQYTKPEKATNLVVNNFTTSSITVSWTQPEGNFSFYIVQWTDGKDPQRENVTITSKSLTGLSPGTLYNISVTTVADDRMTEGAPAAVSQYTKPEKATNLVVNNFTTTSIMVSWTQPEGYFSFYVIQWTVGNVLRKENLTPTSKNITGLSPGTLCDISVTIVADDGMTEGAPAAVSHYTKPGIICEPSASTNTSTMSLKWTPPDGEVFMYQVKWNNRGKQFTKYTNDSFTLLSDLVSGTSYTVTVVCIAGDNQTEGEAYTFVQVTRPNKIDKLEAYTVNSTAIRLVWMKPQEHKSNYTYRIQTTGCGSQNTTAADNVAVILELNPGTQCTFCVFVQTAGGIEGEAECISQFTMPEAVQPSISSQGSNMSVLVSWIRPPGNVDGYSVHLNSSSASQTQPVGSTDNSLLFKGLSAGRLYSAMVMSHSGTFNASSEYVTSATFPNPPGPIEILTKTTNSIEGRWTEAPLMESTSFYYQLTIAPLDGRGYINTTNSSHTFESLHSGTPYNISVATVGVLGFRSEVIQAYLVTTKPSAVTFLSTFAEEDYITVTWLQPDENKESYLYYLTWERTDWPFNGTIATNETMYTVKNLVPGSRYNFSVISKTQDGTQSAPRWISNCTGSSPVRNVTCQGPDNPNAEIVLSWAKPIGQFNDFRITINNMEIICGKSTCDQSCSQTISNLSHYTLYKITMETLSCGQSATPVSHHCRTGITDPPIPVGYKSLVSVKEKVYNRFTIQINTSLMVETMGPITHFGVLLTDIIKESGMANMSAYLGKTHQQWLGKQTPVYLATVKERTGQSRSEDNMLSVDIGDGSEWKGYTNGALLANRRYQYAIVLFTRMKLQDNIALVSYESKFSITNVYQVIELPQNPVVISVAVGATLGIFIILFIILIGFIVYWKRLSKKESSDIQIHSMRSAAVRVEDYEAHYKKQKADSNCGFAEEFEELKLVGTCQSKASALIQENKVKNRYNNVLPYDSSRVKLSIIHGSPYDDYINANYMLGYNSKKEFIAAQGPLPITVKDFWRMIWEKNVHTLVMLTRCNEQGRIKCEQYWHSSTKHFEYIRVTTTSEIPLDDWTIRDFEIKNVKTAETRSVRQFHFIAWPDHGVPETTELLISFRHLVREHMDQYSTNSPTVVHCSAGVGRTGTFIAIDRLIFQIERENVVDVYGVVHDLRMHRPLMVQTEDQYVFLNQCAMDIIRSRTGTNVDLIYQNTAALSIYENVEPRKGYYKNRYHNT